MSRLDKLGFIDARRTVNPVRPRARSRGIPPALEGHEIFYTEDVDEASDLVGQALSPNRLTLHGLDSKRFAASLHGVRLRDVSMLYLDLRVAVTLQIAATGPYVAVHMPMNGRAVCTRNGREFEGNTTRAIVTSPGQALAMRFDYDSPQLIIRIEQEALDRYLARLLGRTLTRPIVFEPEMDLTTDAAVRWYGAVQLLYAEVLHSGSLIQQGQGIGPLEELIMSSLLFLQPSNYYEQLVHPQRRPGRPAVRKALDFIEAHLREPITVNDIARHVHMSVRAIQQGFRDELGTTPMAYLRDRRLERAREELADAIPSDGVTVADVAHRWGFTHLSNFAMLYRKRWGESPSDTLRR
ncbi:AraC family transcriptional regulator [Carbonactinospora thermoautotrophica]|nr:AraC family transcriptional regulator [Carbonactinospora thermoautotrophica]KWX05564.1 AraC family transcriptional regulator [Carbonactinospora thermoautotrophica]KWX06929.1 AraC family transcriptional regulator [Carbonactinospora thermoautotrophica]MCX9192317.1 AraC family transcriptional regulator [Carbonactinospora thermoautotrophica]